MLGNRVKICKNQGSDNEQADPKQKSLEKVVDEKKLLLDKKKAMKKRAAKKGQEGESPDPPAEEQKNHNYKKVLEVVLFEFEVEGRR